MLEHSTQYKHWCFANRKAELDAIKQEKESKYRKTYQKILNKNPQANIQVKNPQSK
jgi:hypothetical protein